jgi:hypothetical protein
VKKLGVNLQMRNRVRKPDENEGMR